MQHFLHPCTRHFVIVNLLCWSGLLSQMLLVSKQFFLINFWNLRNYVTIKQSLIFKFNSFANNTTQRRIFISMRFLALYGASVLETSSFRSKSNQLRIYKIVVRNYVTMKFILWQIVLKRWIFFFVKFPEGKNWD